MKYRKLQIAFSALCGIVCLLLIELWVRSYWRYESVYCFFNNSQGIWLQSLDGTATLRFMGYRGPPRKLQRGWGAGSHQPVPEVTPRYLYGCTSGFFVDRYPDGIWVGAPHWFLAVMSTGVAAASWIHWKNRFSLRTLLAATTLLALILGTHHRHNPLAVFADCYATLRIAFRFGLRDCLPAADRVVGAELSLPGCVLW